MNTNTFLNTLRDKYSKSTKRQTPFISETKKPQKPGNVTPGKICKTKGIRNAEKGLMRLNETVQVRKPKMKEKENEISIFEVKQFRSKEYKANSAKTIDSRECIQNVEKVQQNIKKIFLNM